MNDHLWVAIGCGEIRLPLLRDLTLFALLVLFILVLIKMQASAIKDLLRPPTSGTSNESTPAETGIGNVLGIGVLLALSALALSVLLRVADSACGGANGSVFGVPIAHVSAGLLLVMAGTLTAWMTHATNRREQSKVAREAKSEKARMDTEREREAYQRFAGWVKDSGDPSLHAAAWRCLHDLVRAHGQLAGPTLDHARVALVNYLTATCLDPSCSHGNTEKQTEVDAPTGEENPRCTVHRFETEWVNRILDAMRVCTHLDHEEALDLNGRTVLRSADLTLAGNAVVLAPQKFRLGAEVELTIYAGKEMESLELETKKDAILTVRYTDTNIDRAGIKGPGRVVFNPAGSEHSSNSLTSNHITVPLESTMEFRFNEERGRCLIDELDVEGTVLVQNATRQRFRVKKARDQEGTISLAGQTFDKSQLWIACDSAGRPPASPEHPARNSLFVDLQGSTFKNDSKLVVRGLETSRPEPD